MTADLNTRIWFSTEQAADYASCHPQTVRKALQAGELDGGQRKAKGRWRISRASLDAWLGGASV